MIGEASRVLEALDRNPSPLAVITWSQGGAGRVEEIRSRLPGGTVVEALVRPEGMLAVESPRHGGHRLLPEHGMFFEFLLPDRPGVRLTLAEVRVGEAYEMAVSSPGTWACRTGIGVCFDRLTPPVFHLVPLPEAAAPAPAPQPRSAGVEGGLAEVFVGMPSPARRG